MWGRKGRWQKTRSSGREEIWFIHSFRLHAYAQEVGGGGGGGKRILPPPPERRPPPPQKKKSRKGVKMVCIFNPEEHKKNKIPFKEKES